MNIFCCLTVIYMTANVCTVAHTSASQKIKVKPLDNLIQKLFETITDQQVKEDVPLIPFKQFYRKQGLYPSAIKLNFHGKSDMAAARSMLSVFDNSGFITSWISSTLLEAYLYGQAPKPTESQLMLTINALKDYVDFNKPYNNSLMFFWPLAYNKTAHFWQATALNLNATLNALGDIPFNLIADKLELPGLENPASYMERIIKNKEVYRHMTHLSSDMDCTFVSLGFGSLLYQMRDQFPQASRLWEQQQNNLTSILDAVKKYAYKPFHNDSQTDSIDPRTYMYLRFFLDDARAAGKDVALVTTWAQNLEELKTETKKGVEMPHNVNNVDVVVCANTVYGITASVLSGLVSPAVLQDADIAQIYHNSSALLAYEIQTNLSNRPDLALLYYPSQMEFNWFVSRTVAMLETARANGPFPASVMEEVYEMLQKATKGSMTKYILSEAKQDEEGGVYYDGFLGDGDLTHDNKPLMRGEDRIFTTAMATNALLCTWTNFNEISRKSSWKEDAPPQVKRVVSDSIRWLTKYTLSGRYKPWNAMFSTSIKGETTEINQYPANLFQDVNGTMLPWTQSYNILTDTLAVKGYIPPTEYSAMLKEKKSPLVFHGYNTPGSVVMFWCSEAFTYSAALLALSRHGGIVD
ncbi:hypothetical protein BsWGS_27764 [Bradybaena similaris]